MRNLLFIILYLLTFSPVVGREFEPEQQYDGNVLDRFTDNNKIPVDTTDIDPAIFDE